jgi:integrase
MELALLHPAAATASEDPYLPPTILRLLEGVERSLTAQNSRRAYRTSLLQFVAWCGSGKGDGSFSRLSILQYKDELIGAGTESEAGMWKRLYSPATINLRLAAVRALAQEAADAGLISQSEAAAIRRTRGEKQAGSRIGNWLQKQEVDQILTAVDRSSLRGKRDYAILAVLFTTGLRRRELVELQVATIQQRDGQWGFIGLRGKGGKVRNISLPEWVRLAITNWLTSTRIVQGSVFRSISRHGKLGMQQMSDESVKLILSHYARVCGHDDFRPHDARRTCARLCRSGNAALEDVQELLGHSSIQTTERYIRKDRWF